MIWILSTLCCFVLPLWTMEQETPIVYVTDTFLEGRLVEQDPLEYPQMRWALVPGFVLFSVTVDETGKVEESKLLHGHPLLNPAAQRQLLSKRYRPYVRGTARLKMRGNVTIVFDFAQHPILGLDLPTIRILDEHRFAVGVKTLNSRELRQWIEAQESRANERIIHVWIPGDTRIDEIVRTLRSVQGLIVALHFED